MMRYLTTIVMIISCCFVAQAQDPHYSQYYNTAQHLSPAMTGVFNGKYRLGIAYRDQWSSLLNAVSFKTMLASFDIKYRMGKSDFFALGMNMLRDEVGEGRLNQTLGHLNASYMKQIAGSKYSKAKQYIVLGLQAGAGQNSLDYGKFWFGRQFNVAAQTIEDISSSGEPNALDPSLQSNIYMDLGLGLMWYALFDENNSVSFGFAMNHLNNPDISLTDSGDLLHRKLTVHGSAQLTLNSKWSLMPSTALFFQGPSFQANFGSYIRYTKNDRREIAVRLGFFDRIAKTIDGFHMDAIIATTMLEFGNFDLALSYDVTSSDLANANSRRGAVELTINYIAPMGERKMQIICPKF